jgi:acetyl esterase/lipase
MPTRFLAQKKPLMGLTGIRNLKSELIISFIPTNLPVQPTKWSQQLFLRNIHPTIFLCWQNLSINMKYIFLLFFLPIVCQAQEAKTYNYDGELALDVYNGGGTSDRSLLIFVHGGGFAGGSRDSEGVVDFCLKLAAENVVVASVSYELKMKGRGFGCDIPASEKVSVLREAGEDVAMATRYLLENSDELGFNPAKVVLAGSSAGAETVLHLAYWDETYKGILPREFAYAGVISFAGAIIDLALVQEKNAIPAMLIHGTCDNLVPYGSAPHHYCDYQDAGYLELHGAGSIAERYQELGKSYALYTVCGGSHEWASIPVREMSDDVRAFIASYIELGQPRQAHEWLITDGTCNYPGTRVCPN